MRLKAICEIIEQFSDVCNILKADDIKEEFYYLYYREGDCGQGGALKKEFCTDLYYAALGQQRT